MYETLRVFSSLHFSHDKVAGTEMKFTKNSDRQEMPDGQMTGN